MLSTESISHIEMEWAGAEVMLSAMRSRSLITFSRGRGAVIGVDRIIYNLPLLLAADVLCQTLRIAKEEGQFSAKKHTLGGLVKASKEILPWVDWDSIWEAVDRRNAIAHDGALYSRRECQESIDSIREQLVQWGIIQEKQGVRP